MKPVGKPDAGNPHVRFDERRLETELWRELRHRHGRKPPANSTASQPTATAPVVDSTGVLHQQPANRIGGQSDVEVLNARKVYRLGNKIQQILLAIEDVTERARLEREHAAAHERIGMLLQELTHRVKNSLQFIASMVMIEARSHKSGEGKAALERVSHRITALGQLYSKLSKANTVEAVDAATYLDMPRPDRIST